MWVRGTIKTAKISMEALQIFALLNPTTHPPNSRPSNTSTVKFHSTSARGTATTHYSFPVSYIVTKSLRRSCRLATYCRFHDMLKSRIRHTRSIKFWTARRAYSESKAPITINHPTIKYTLLTTRALIEVGPNVDDVRSFLHGLVTADILTRKEPPSSYYTAFLNASGRMLDDVFIYPPLHKLGATSGRLPPPTTPSHYLIEVDRTRADALIGHLKKHKLRRKIYFRLMRPDEGGVYGLWTDGPNIDPLTSLKPYLEPAGFWKLDQRSNMGCRCILKSQEEMEAALGPPNATMKDYMVHRMRNGVAEGPLEIVPETALPQESNLDLFGGIDFRKGCYLGQELTIRTHHTGVIRKRIIPVQLYDDTKPTFGTVPEYNSDSVLSLPPAGSKILSPTKSFSRTSTAGHWLDGVGNIGLALCRLQKMTDIRTGQDSDANQLFRDPYEEEFRAIWNGQDDNSERSVGIRAFVPPWMRLGIEQKLDPVRNRS